MEIESILAAYKIDLKAASLEFISSGLINATWKISSGGNQFILQRINDNVFKEPQQITANVRLLANYIKMTSVNYLLISAIKTQAGEELAYESGKGYFRLTPFVNNSKTIQVVETPEQAYEAALQFGKFTKIFSGFEVSMLKVMIPDFHNLTFRYQQFEHSLRSGNQQRIKDCSVEIATVQSYSHLVREYNRILNDQNFKLRVTHHDTKISNVLFDANDKGICVIDLDTVMPGYFISDVGDMIRTYISPINEEESDFHKIEIRNDFFQAIVAGYLENMRDELSKRELDSFFYSGLFLTYMQAIRFLTDYFNKDQYYRAQYEKHNLVRAQNQLHLLTKLVRHESQLMLNVLK